MEMVLCCVVIGGEIYAVRKILSCSVKNDRMRNTAYEISIDDIGVLGIISNVPNTKNAWRQIKEVCVLRNVSKFCQTFV